MQLLDTISIIDKNISSPSLLATFVATGNGEVFLQVYLTGLAGGGSYKLCITKQIGGAGVVYQSPTTVIAVGSGTATLFFPAIVMPVSESDVVNVYAEGLEADLEVNGAVEVFDGNSRLSAELMGRMACILIGDVTGARTAAEVFAYNGVTGTVSADENGNRTIVFS